MTRGESIDGINGMRSLNGNDERVRQREEEKQEHNNDSHDDSIIGYIKGSKGNQSMDVVRGEATWE